LLLYHTSTNEIYTLSLHDALPISEEVFHDEHEHHRGDDQEDEADHHRHEDFVVKWRIAGHFDRYSRREGSLCNGTDNDRFDCKGDRKSTRLNSSHVKISYAVFCLK